MGNSSSSAATGASADALGGSGVSLSANLQGQIVQDFNAKVQAAFLQRNQARQQNTAANSELAQRHKQFLQSAVARQQRLDDRFDALSAGFHDRVVSADYDASRLQDQYVKQEQILGPEDSCAEVRGNYVTCQSKQTEPTTDCEIYIQALQDCVSKVISDK